MKLQVKNVNSQVSLRVAIIAALFWLYAFESRGADALKDNIELKLYERFRNNLNSKDYKETEGVVIAIRILYSLCGVDQMVTVTGVRDELAKESIKYRLEVASKRIDDGPSVKAVVNNWNIDEKNLAELFNLLKTKEIFSLPLTQPERDPNRGILFFAVLHGF